MASEISIFRGDTQTITITVTDSDDTVFNLTDYTMKMSVKTNKTDPDISSVISSTATIAAPATGVGVFSLSTTDTTVDAGNYFYDVQINNGIIDVKTVISSTFIVKEDITKTAA